MRNSRLLLLLLLLLLLVLLLVYVQQQQQQASLYSSSSRGCTSSIPGILYQYHAAQGCATVLRTVDPFCGITLMKANPVYRY